MLGISLQTLRNKLNEMGLVLTKTADEVIDRLAELSDIDKAQKLGIPLIKRLATARL